MNSKMSRIASVVVIICISLLLTVQQYRISNLQNQIKNSTEIAFNQQFKPGFSCGLLTTKQAVEFLELKDIVASGTILPNNGPTANVRIGSPRLDSCSYTALSNNLTYLDIIIKTYSSNQDAQKGFNESKAQAQSAKTGSFQNDQIQDTYASGVHYMQIDKLVLEIGASKKGAMLGQDQELFVDKIVAYITSKL